MQMNVIINAYRYLSIKWTVCISIYVNRTEMRA